MSTPKHKGQIVRIFVPTTDYDAWFGLAKQSKVSVPTAIYSLAVVALKEMLERERKKLEDEKGKNAINSNSPT